MKLESQKEIKDIIKIMMKRNNLNVIDLTRLTGNKESTIKTYLSSNKSIAKKFLKKMLETNLFKKNEINQIEKFINGNSNMPSKEELIDFQDKIIKEIKKKEEELNELERNFKMLEFEYEKLERTSGIRSKVTWGCIEVQKFNAEKLIEIANIYSLADEKNQVSLLPALKQLVIHFETFSENIRKIISNKEYLRMEDLGHE